MRLAVAAAALLVSSTAALAQPGATAPNQPYGPPPAPAPTYGQPAPAPTYGQPAPAPTYGQPAPAPTYGQPAPAPTYGPPAPAPTYGQPYAPQPYAPYAPRPYPQQYAPYQQQQPVGGLSRPLVIKKIKDPGTARMLAIGTTGLGFLGMLAASEDNNEQLGWASLGLTLVGPSVGHIYAGEAGRALKGTLIRTGGLLTFLWGVNESTQGACIDYCYDDGSNDEGEVAMYVGGAVVLISTLYDFYDSARAANRYNEKAARALTVGPTVMSSARGGTSPGVALSGSF